MIKAVDLRTESLQDPIGISVKNPRFSWKLQGEPGKTCQRQSAYRIVCGASPEDLDSETYIWDSGKVQSDQTAYIPLPSEIKSRQRICWKIKAWDENGEEGPYSSPAWFEEGLLSSSDWKAGWIDPEMHTDPEKRQPASYLRKKFTVSADIKSARLYMTACGIYECYLNGVRIGDQILTPGTTQYNKRIQVQTYDVGNLLRQGENVIAAVIGDGWFRGMNGMQRRRNVYGEHIALLGQLEISYSSGETACIVTDTSWKASQNGPLRFDDLMQGEIYDARLEQKSWNQAEFDDSGWHTVKSVDLGYEMLTGSDSVPVKEHESFTPKILYTSGQETVLDFGQNISGYVSFKVEGNKDTAGRKIEITHGEALDKEGRFTMANLEENFDKNTPPLKQKIEYIMSDQKEQEYKPCFSTFGFRYIQVKNWPGDIEEDMFRAHAVYSDVEITARFECSNPLINKLVQNTVWSLKGNFVDVPTDCPQRERAGYTGDAQVFVKTGTILADSLPFYRKWLADLRATQNKTGKLSNIAPMQQKEFEYFDGSAGWGDAIVIVPYVLYQQYGDPEILKENYQAMKAWTDYEIREAKKDHPLRKFIPNRYKKYIWDTGKHWGEWLEPGQTMSYLIKRMYLGCPETATAYMFYSCRLLGKIADIIGKKEDALYYTRQAKIIRKAYQKTFLKKAFRSKRQCLSVRPLFMGLADAETAKKLAAHLNQLVIDNGYHLNTGFLSTPHICGMLEKYGYTDTAYRLLEQEEIPGWLYSVKKGATTIWEKWDSVKEDGTVSGSLNHYSYGAVTGWLFTGAAGIRAASPGYKEFVIAPAPGGGLTDLSASYKSCKGLIESAWKIRDKECEIKVTVPVNTSAVICLPVKSMDKVLELPEGVSAEEKNGRIICRTGSGCYRFRVMYQS